MDFFRTQQALNRHAHGLDAFNRELQELRVLVAEQVMGDKDKKKLLRASEAVVKAKYLLLEVLESVDQRRAKR